MQRTMFAVALFASASALAADRDFQDIVDAISDEFHTRPIHIPLFGLVNVVTFVARPAGTKHVNLAVFENLGRPGASRRDPGAVIRSSVGSSWRPFVQVQSKRTGS